jgi:hypothetical protein
MRCPCGCQREADLMAISLYHCVGGSGVFLSVPFFSAAHKLRQGAGQHEAGKDDHP